MYGLAEKSLMESQLFNETIQNASATNSIPKNSMFLFTLRKDSVVSPNNTFKYLEIHKKSGWMSSYIFNNSLYQVCEFGSNIANNVDHSSG